MSIREKRLRDATNALNRTTAQREAAISTIVRCEIKIKTLRRQVLRLERPVTPKPIAPKPAPKPTVSDVTDIPFTELPIADKLEIPTFLQRSKEAAAKDKAAADAIRQEQAERKKQKRDNKDVVPQSKKLGPDAQRMPLTGRAALQALRQRA